jgi:predicted nucleotidyltransferase
MGAGKTEIAVGASSSGIDWVGSCHTILTPVLLKSCMVHRGRITESGKTMELDQIIRIIQALNEQKVDYVVVGGIAVNFQGIPRYTEDLDLIVRATAENISNLRRALKSIYMDPTIEELTAEELSSYSVVRYGTPDGFYIDLMVKLGDFASYDDILSETIEIEGTPVKTATVEALHWMKRDTVRQKDKADARLLRELMRMIETGKVHDDEPPA